MSRVETITLGCRLNMAESATMQRRLEAAGAGPTVIVNSCAVTHEAVRQTRQTIRRARRDHPEARLLVTGCAAQIEPETFRAMPEVDALVGNADKLDAGEIASATKDLPGDVMTAPAPPVAAGFARHVRSFVAVQTGCDHRCTFCTIPYGRGNSQSLPYAAVRRAVAAELDRGASEIVITGVDITSYERDGLRLGALLQRMLADEPRLQRLRLSSLDSIEMDGALYELLSGDARLLPHFHLSLQAGDDMILKRMKRRHSRRQAVGVVERLKAARPEVTIGADIIAGFPTETEEMFENSLALIEDCDIVAAHVFPFSPRDKTPAARMPQLDRALVKARAARLRARAAAHRRRWLEAQVGTRQPCLIENSGKGHSDGFAPITVDGAARGAYGQARIIAADEQGLTGVFE
ncbi:tRNA (N(6)-L-threonylcarbamoyladenosine(37)-C(2))-methylthiotransferase MtaB [Sphingomicrobium astaxanthinifaciens]|uniref:tRNA (N(6)-L-threonylcarbamoyladenosine(37)-C(2))- methylthiotransferase MtaB n=1 Tax=Sphingomicrobium astaxanthinifaciens TaxID=1227949 RepID=UPI001FCC4FDF|nr:tRNA (N(6)-L-threonylcarbamoyladenosine(37)-C(2))-methylthiotransferase MtaB [Sphingomicrobium astaxanthinifaciens]MCJ7422272.1 tRNA (N(6)-L-threonylcarbamoyladenosine(37)-C(2))-methylthiotransferase MtaB [Sphingomicrobium astaxanthinifaciens]